jgi:hypothetical protein
MSKSHEIFKLTSLSHITIRERCTKSRLLSLSVTTANNLVTSGLTEATSPFYVVWEQSPAQGVPRKGQYSINTNMLQLQVCGRRGTSYLELSRLQAHQGRDAKEKVTEYAKDYNGKGILFQPNHSRTSWQCYTAATQPQLPSVAKACPATVGEMSALLP